MHLPPLGTLRRGRQVEADKGSRAVQDARPHLILHVRGQTEELWPNREIFIHIRIVAYKMLSSAKRVATHINNILLSQNVIQIILILKKVMHC